MSYEGSQTLSSWPANKLASYSPVDDGRRCETLELEMKDGLLLTEIAVDRVPAFSHCSPELQFPQGDTKRAR